MSYLSSQHRRLHRLFINHMPAVGLWRPAWQLSNDVPLLPFKPTRSFGVSAHGGFSHSTFRTSTRPIPGIGFGFNLPRPYSTTASKMATRPTFKTEPAFEYTQAPNTDWKLGQGLSHETKIGKEWIAGEEQGFKTIDPAAVSPGALYPLMISGIIPRPIAFVSSESATGERNLSPFSYFGMISHNPPLVSVSFSQQATRDRDTSIHIRETKTFTVNIISEPFVEAANWTSVDAPVDVSEWKGSGLTPEPSTLVKPPRVKESAFSMECELFQIHDISPPGSTKITTTLVLGLVKLFHVRNDVCSTSPHSGHTIVDATKLRAVSRLGGITYARVGEGFEIKRPVWEDVKGDVEKL